MPLFNPPSVLQTLFVELTSDTTTTSGSFVDIPGLTLTFDTAGGSSLIIDFTVAGSNSTENQDMQFQLVIDGSPIRGTNIRPMKSGAGDTTSSSLTYRYPDISAASHTVKMQWLVTGGTGRVLVASQIRDHASLRVTEVTV